MHDSIEVPKPPTRAVVDNVQARFVELVAVFRTRLLENPFTDNTLIVELPAEAPARMVRVVGPVETVKTSIWYPTETL